MPLFQSPQGKAALALTKDGTSIIAYALTAAAVKRLREHGVRHGRNFPSQLLVSLIRSGDAHSPRVAEAEGQQALFSDDTTADLLPRCEVTGSSADLHLVVVVEGQQERGMLLGPEARLLHRKATVLSIPIATLTLASLGALEAMHKVPVGSAALVTLRQWFIKDYEAEWKKLEKALGGKQASLGLEGAEELKLDISSS